MTQHLPALATILNLLVLFGASLNVGLARGKYGVKLPATTGNVDFERAFRAHMNTLEWSVMFLPAMWLFSIYISPLWAGAVGVVWSLSRVFYVIGYVRSVEARNIPFQVGAACFASMALGSLFGVIKAMCTV